MADDRQRQTLAPGQLRAVLDRLNEVLEEAERLRDEITRQLTARQQEQQQYLTPVGRKRKRAKR
jgi:hypothetical protein